MTTEEQMIIYDNQYDYDDIKIAVCITEYLNKINYECDFEYIAFLVVEIKDNWCADKLDGCLSKTEYAYIQEYAYRYLKEKFEK